jgi:hypothetical protein
MSNIDKKTKDATKNVDKFGGAMFSFGLSALFTGMAIKRLADTMLKSMVKTFVAVRGEGDFFNNKLLEMQASFEFLKFAIFDAFAQSDLFIPMVNAIVTIVNFVSKFIAKRPALAVFIVTFTLMAIAAGLLLMIVGQLTLASIGLAAVMGSTVGVGAAMGIIIGMTILLATVTGILVTLWTSDMSTASKVFLSISTILLGIAAALILLGKVSVATFFAFMLNPVTLLIIALSAAVLAIFNLQDAMGGLGAFSKTVIGGLIKGFIAVGNVINNQLINPLLNLVQIAIKAAEAVGAKGIAGGLRKIEFNLIKTSGAFDSMTNSALRAVDKAFAGAEVRERAPGIDNPLTFLKTAFLGADAAIPKAPDTSSLDAFSEDIALQTENIAMQTEKLDNISGGSSLADIALLQEEANDLQKAMLEQNKVTEGLNTNITVNGLFDESGMEQFLIKFFRDNKDRFIGSTSGG